MESNPCLPERRSSATEPTKRKSKCAVCESSTDLNKASVLDCRYFSLPITAGKHWRLCSRCTEQSCSYEEELTQMIREQKPLSDAPKPPERMTVLLSDSDDDADDGSLETSCDNDMVTIEGDLEKIVLESLVKFDFKGQLDALEKKTDSAWSTIEETIPSLQTDLRDLERNIDKLRTLYYSQPAYQFQHLPPLDIPEESESRPATFVPGITRLEKKLGPPKDEAGEIVALAAKEQKELPSLPPSGRLERPILQKEALVYVKRNRNNALRYPWVKARVLGHEKNVAEQIRYNDGKTRTIEGRDMAYSTPSTVQYPVGTRVIAQYVDEQDADLKKMNPVRYYAGIVAEPPKLVNRFRYLIFFDDGYAQYASHDQILLVHMQSENVAFDIHEDTRGFVEGYLAKYPERAMVKLQKGQPLKTEWNGQWWYGRVIDVDASLVRIYFDADNRDEWIYRGSTRLGPLYVAMHTAETRKHQGLQRARHDVSAAAHMKKQRNTPYVEYTRAQDNDQEDATKWRVTIPSRAVARKSTAKRSVEIVDDKVREPKRLLEHKGFIKEKANPMNKPTLFKPHECGPSCLASQSSIPRKYKGNNPLAVPMLCGWARELVKQNSISKQVVMYRAPCGKRLRAIKEVHRYLRMTNSEMGVDLFCFEDWVRCFAEFVPENVKFSLQDVSYGKENVAVSCVNSIDTTEPDRVDYCTQRRPSSQVKLILDESFLVCCDCTDNCQNKQKCACWQLTIQNSARENFGKLNQDAGYNYRRLSNVLTTGIYECNSRCSCRSTCLNRVVQHPMNLLLQVFRTENRGWGIRCLNDIPKGGFICIYAGKLLTEQEANERGQCDEYFADLDYIEVQESLKEGYEDEAPPMSDNESGLSDSDDDLQATTSDRNSDTEFCPSRAYMGKQTRISDIASSRGARDVNSKFMRKVPIEGQKAGPVSNPLEDKAPYVSLREFYGENEQCYVMDAKTTGNIGRYLNHSCSPNVFVQNVFVDTHDLRFPWVAFFAKVFIRAGTELTWDYAYEVGSVADKVLYCGCGSVVCKGRLL